MPTPAPIAVFIYNRPDHLRATLASLMQCAGFHESPVVVFGDGPKNEGQQSHVDAARAVAKAMLGARADYRFSPVNKGLARSIIDGVTTLVTEHGRVVVVEDDLQLAPGFLTYVNTALDLYENDKQVYQVSGHAFAVPELADSSRAVMLPWTTTWGWGTWRRAWLQLDETSSGWEDLATDQLLRRRFNLDGVYDYASMMERQQRGLSDSWGIRWYWTAFRQNGLAVFPPVTLVRNSGMDGSGSHGRGVFRSFSAASQPFPDAAFEFPENSAVDPATYAAVRRAIWRQNGGLVGHVVDRLKNLVVARSIR